MFILISKQPILLKDLVSCKIDKHNEGHARRSSKIGDLDYDGREHILWLY